MRSKENSKKIDLVNSFVKDLCSFNNNWTDMNKGSQLFFIHNGEKMYIPPKITGVLRPSIEGAPTPSPTPESSPMSEIDKIEMPTLEI